MSTTKIESSVSNFEQDSRDLLHVYPKMRTIAILDSSRVFATALALAASVTVLGLSADALAVYSRTHVPAEFLLPLWPQNFDIRPTHALIATSVIVMVTSLASLAVSKTSSLRAGFHTSINMAAPLIGFIVSLISMAFYYGVNASSTHTFQSWTCRWSGVPMQVEPHFETLCQQSQVGLGLTILLVPLEAIVLGMAAYQAAMERKVDVEVSAHERKASSPALS
ncbi:hypothetical protein B0I35DRAFT_270495 [Stachybotrys elegans]|uniref:Uncharacterized protein n=1 Tax=Stachybotrys elegans TaxID=80388 RepID=A0A8K0SP23_9HYPO|nr:hypothetical protein B0I35DRAFT_270495 [Stachybotrys elegans]